jgi:hypothetical protein
VTSAQAAANMCGSCRSKKQARDRRALEKEQEEEIRKKLGRRAGTSVELRKNASRARMSLKVTERECNRQNRDIQNMRATHISRTKTRRMFAEMEKRQQAINEWSQRELASDDIDD